MSRKESFRAIDAHKALMMIRRVTGGQQPKFIQGLDDVGLNGVIQVRGQNFIVADVYLYSELNKKGKKTGFTWKEFQLVDPLTGQIVYLELEKDDELEAYITEKELAAREVQVSDDFSEAEVNGQPFYLEEKCQVEYQRLSDGDVQRYTSYDFESESSDLLSIEEWETGLSAFSYREISLGSIKVRANGEV